MLLRIKQIGLVGILVFGWGCQSKQDAVSIVLEKFRPEYHFTPEANWMNDPNGMVYYEGEYHLFYQYYPDSTVWGPMHWGHAVSTDLVTWEHLPVALYPDDLGYIFSGSAVIDWNNTSGFGTGDQPAMVAIYTYHDPVGEKEGTIDFQTQGIAHSLDKGRTWTKYEENPVIKNPGIRDFRDPKVIWNEEMGRWIMTLAVKDHISFYSSPDLKDWQFESDFGIDVGNHGGVWECPDLFQLPVNGTGGKRWVLLVSINPGGPNGGSATQYFVGDFVEGTFKLDPDWKPVTHESIWVDYGPDNYAGVTWSDIPEEDGRRIFMGWMSNWQYAQVVPTKKWRSAMTIARKLELSMDNGEYRLHSLPVQELKTAFERSTDIASSDLTEASYIDVLSPESKSSYAFTASISLELADGSIGEISLENDHGQSMRFVYDRDGAAFEVDRSDSGMTDFQPGFSKTHRAPYKSVDELNLRLYVDRSSVELFTEDGLVITEIAFPSDGFNKIRISAKRGEVKLKGGTISTLSI